MGDNGQHGGQPGPQPAPGAIPAVLPGAQPGAHPVPDPGHPPTPPQHEQAEGYDERIRRLEDQLKEYQRANKRAKRGYKRSESRSTRRSTSSRRSGSRQKSRSHSPRSRRRRSTRSRSRSRHSTRSRRRSTSRRRSSTRSPKRRRSTRSRSDGDRRSKTPRHTRSRSSSRHRRDGTSNSRRSPTSPRSTRKTTALREQADKALKAQYPDMGKGKGEPIPVKGLPLEPYYNLPPDLRSKAKSRRSRRDLTFPEYMCGTLNLAARSIPKNVEVHALITHAAQVAQDAAGYTWPAVREWSQTCLSYIEDGKEVWAKNSDLFRNDRTRLSWIKGKPPQEIRIPCHAHNVDKCNERATHYSEGKTWVHGCAVCVYGLPDDPNSQSALTHTTRTCRRKTALRYSGDDTRNDMRRKPNQPQYRRDNRPEPPKAKN